MAKYEEWLTEDGLLLIAAWARNGLTLEQIAGNMGIARQTLNEWRKAHDSISNALKLTRELADIEVENALYKRAVGYDYEEETVEDGPKGTKVTHTKKRMAPDVTAQIFWLKNRKPFEWRDRKNEIEADESGETGGALMPDASKGGDNECSAT